MNFSKLITVAVHEVLDVLREGGYPYRKVRGTELCNPLEPPRNRTGPAKKWARESCCTKPAKVPTTCIKPNQNSYWCFHYSSIQISTWLRKYSFGYQNFQILKKGLFRYYKITDRVWVESSQIRISSVMKSKKRKETDYPLYLMRIQPIKKNRMWIQIFFTEITQVSIFGSGFYI